MIPDNKCFITDSQINVCLISIISTYVPNLFCMLSQEENELATIYMSGWYIVQNNYCNKILYTLVIAIFGANFGKRYSLSQECKWYIVSSK